MYVPKSLMLNEFKLVAIPRNRDYFARYGNFNPAAQQYTGDEVVPQLQRKVDEIASTLSELTRKSSEVQ